MGLLRKLLAGHADSGRGSAGADARPAGDAEYLCERGATLYEAGRAREARDCLLRAAALGAHDAALPYRLGWSCFASGRIDEALDWMRKAVAADPTQARTHFGLAIALQARGRAAEALRSFEEALARSPADFDCLIQLGICTMDQGDLAAAESIFRRAIEVRGGDAAGWTNLGVALSRQRRRTEALEAYERADRIECATGESVGNFVNLAVELSDAGRLEESLAVYERHLPQQPSAAGHFGYAGVLMRAGRLREGWVQYEYRWAHEPYRSSRPRHGKPVWSGQSLAGRTLLLEAEQGFGDTIQFVRYAPMCARLGATVLLRARGGVASLARGVPGIDRVLAPGDAVPDFDFYAPLMSLPRAFGTELGTVPAGVPYVNVDSARRARWIERLRGMPGRKVGLAWAGNPRHSRDRYRSIELDAFAPLGGIEGVQFVSLQKDAPASWGSEPPRGMAWLDPTPELHDFEDTAALVDALDLVIAVDTAVLHLAGALGKPAWALLPAPPDFRWMDIGDVTPWYPTMRLFRQRQRDDWNDVLRRVAIALQEASAPADRMRRTLHDEAAAGARGAQAVPDPPNRGAAFGTRAGLFAIAETRHGLLQYRPDDTPAGKSLDWYGEYLQAELDLLASLLGPGMTVIEVGAGIGAHSVALAALLGADGHLMLYESDPVSRHVLQQNLSVAGATNVTIMRGMIGASPGEQAGAGAASESPGSTQARSTETLDDLGLARLDLLKVNASAGPDVLRGATDALWSLRPSLLVATRDHLALADAADRVRNVGYRCWRLATPLFNPGNFNRRSDDIFEGQAMLAMLALPEEKEVPGGLGACVPLC